MKIGEELKISDGNNQNYLCAVEEMMKESVRVKILETFCTDTESSCRIVLFQGLPKSDKMDWIVQKSVELGVSEIVPMATARAVVKLDEKKAKKKTERWQAVSESAAKQAGRGKIPEVKQVMGFSEALTYAGTLDHVLIPYELAEGMEETRRQFSSLRAGGSIGILIGPEGGFGGSGKGYGDGKSCSSHSWKTDSQNGDSRIICTFSPLISNGTVKPGVKNPVENIW